MLYFALIGALALVAVIATVVTTIRDGYRSIPNRPH